MSVTDLTTDEIETRLTSLEAMIAQARSMQATLLREVDLRQVPLADGCRNLSEWIGSRLDISPETASLLARLVKAEKPAVDEALASAEITFDRAVELTRLDSLDPVADGAGFAIPRLRQVAASKRRVTRRDEREAYAERHLVLQPNLDHTALRLWGELVGAETLRFEQVLMELADSMPALPHGRREPLRARMADALVNTVIDGGAGQVPETAAMVTVFVDAAEATATNAETGVVLSDGRRLGPQALDAILCEAMVEVTATIPSFGGRVLGIGDRSHVIPPRIRRYVAWRDKGCTADGCTSRYRLQAHHIRHRAAGADNDPRNLTLLCWFHHHVVIHGHGYRIDPGSTPGRYRFIRPDP